MPRRARLAIAGIPWHIIQRGNNRSACFFHRDDYQYYLRTLAAQSRKFECAVHAYVLMTNHIHLLLTPSEKDGASSMMKHLGQRYTQYINRTYRRSGTLWEGRFHSCLTSEDNYVLACYRYIEMNPVRAHLARAPGDYEWSSYRRNAQGARDRLITEHEAYLGLSHNAAERYRAYRGLFSEGSEQRLFEHIRAATYGNYALGSEGFQTEIEKMLKRRATPGKCGRPKQMRDD